MSKNAISLEALHTHTHTHTHTRYSLEEINCMGGGLSCRH